MSAMLGHQAWGVSLGVGSFLTIEFGRAVPPEKPGGKVHGEWHLWIYFASWRLLQDGALKVSSNTNRKRIEAAIRIIEGQKLLAARLNSRTLKTTLVFKDKIELIISPDKTVDDAEYWMLFTPNGSTVSVGPGRNFLIENDKEVVLDNSR